MTPMKRSMGRVNSWGQIAFVISPIIGGLIIGDAAQEKFIQAIALTVLALLIGLLVSFSLREPVRDSGEKRSRQHCALPRWRCAAGQ